MLLRKATLTQAARRHFGLPRDPFNDEINSADDVYLTPDVRYVREAMFQTACHGGFVAVVGESGAGKSTLREDLQDRIMREGKQIVMIEPYVLAMEDNDQKGKTLKAVHIAEAILAAVAPNVSPKRSPEARFAQIHRAFGDAAQRRAIKFGEVVQCPLINAVGHQQYFNTFFAFTVHFVKMLEGLKNNLVSSRT